MEIKVIEPKKKLLERLRVCAYCRVSTEEDEQANSLENQMAHYEEAMRELAKQGTLTEVVPELVQTVLESIVVKGDGAFEIRFLDGTEFRMKF